MTRPSERVVPPLENGTNVPSPDRGGPPPAPGPRARPFLQHGVVSRRGVLLGGGLAALLAACDSQASPNDRAGQDMSTEEKVVDWSNWPDYIDLGVSLGDYPTLRGFTKETGIRVNYTTDYYDNEQFVAPAMRTLKRGQQLARDVWCSTDWIVARLGVMEFLASGLGDTAIVNDQTYLRGIQHIDAGPRHAVVPPRPDGAGYLMVPGFGRTARDLLRGARPGCGTSVRSR